MTTNSDRARWALVALDAFVEETDMADEDFETQLTDLLCDLMHSCDMEKVDWNRCLAMAQDHYSEELTEAASEGQTTDSPEPETSIGIGDTIKCIEDGWQGRVTGFDRIDHCSMIVCHHYVGEHEELDDKRWFDPRDVRLIRKAEPIEEPAVTITCGLCGKAEKSAEDAVKAGWISSYWNGDIQIHHPVCRECATEKTKCLDGDSVLIEETITAIHEEPAVPVTWMPESMAELDKEISQAIQTPPMIPKPPSLSGTLQTLVDRLRALTTEHERLEHERTLEHDDRPSLMSDEQIDKRENEIFEECFEIAQGIVNLHPSA